MEGNNEINDTSQVMDGGGAGTMGTNESLDAHFTKQRARWTQKVTALNKKLCSLVKTDELLNEIYGERQSLVEEYYGYNRMLSTYKKNYNQYYTQYYNQIKLSGYQGVKYTSDAQIARVIDAHPALVTLKETIDIFNTHCLFLEDTVKSFDGLGYAIREKIEIHKILNGLKF